jgi:murein L,D-transpeptidase YafK
MEQDTDPFLPNSIIYPGQKSGLIMVVNKAEQLLFVYRHDGQGNIWLDRILPCSTGMIQGDKLIRGDKKTPEGYYIFRQKLLPYELPDIYGILAYPMDYPNFWDRKIGRGGDGIWAHGINKPLVDFDSNGCIEIQNHDIAALENEIKLHETPILVYDQVEFASKEDLKKEAEDINNFVETWRQAWSTKDIPKYITYYDTDFYNTDELSYTGWIDRKTRVAAGYKKINIDISDLRIYRHRDTVVVSFTQDYQGDNSFRSLGYKRLYLKGQLGSWRIVAEEYGPLPSPPPEKWLTAQEKNLALTTPPLAVAQLTEPVAAASAGVFLPSAPTLMASQVTESQTEAQAAADEAARAALEQRTSQQQTGQPPEVTVLASLSSQDSPLIASANTGTVDFSSSEIDSSGQSQEEAESQKAQPILPGNEAGSSPTTSAEESGSQPQASDPSELQLEKSPVSAERASESSDQNNQSQIDVPSAATQNDLKDGNQNLTQGTVNEAEPESPTDALNADTAKLLLESWLAAWSAKNDEAYFSFYAPDFIFKDLNLHFNSFKRFRSRRFQEAGNIQIEASDIEVKVSGDTATVTFTQEYQSDRHHDRGIKTLELGARDGQWRIISESFQARP